MQETVFALTPSPNLSPKGERNMNHERVDALPDQQRRPRLPRQTGPWYNKIALILELSRRLECRAPQVARNDRDSDNGGNR
jgi:hypothetical protein